MDDDPLFAPLRLGKHALPGIWRYLLPEDAQWLNLPAERLATCDHCYWAQLGTCRDDCRCCTYFPQLPNYLIGLALKDPASRPVMEHVIQSGHALPEGLLANPQLFRRSVQSHAEGRFGEEPDLICPFLRPEDQGCAIHAYRNSVCATFFCEHDHGEEGARMWRGLQALTGHGETALAQWAMEHAGIPSAGYFHQLDNLASDMGTLSGEVGWSLPARETLWDKWFGREVAFFEACADAVMERRDDLYEVACLQTLRQADTYEDALLAWLPDEIRSEAPPATHGEPIPIPELWYRLQLALRQLWALPFGEGKVQVAQGLTVGINAKNDRLSQVHESASHMLQDSEGKALLYCNEIEARVLKLFGEARVLGEALFERDEILALDDARTTLAEWMRREILIPV